MPCENGVYTPGKQSLTSPTWGVAVGVGIGSLFVIRNAFDTITADRGNMGYFVACMVIIAICLVVLFVIEPLLHPINLQCTYDGKKTEPATLPILYGIVVIISMLFISLKVTDMAVQNSYLPSNNASVVPMGVDNA